jgi:hypothetical protein
VWQGPPPRRPGSVATSPTPRRGAAARRHHGHLAMRLIHTADWQIGKVFRFAGDATMHVLQEARLEAISTIGRLAIEHGASHVLVAGDVYDGTDMGERALRQPIERMRHVAGLAWHLIPGNHDPHRPDGVWDRLRRGDLPANVHLHLEPEPVGLEGDRVYLLPAPLSRRATAQDATAWMDEAPTPEGAIRLGLAHGTVVRFGSEESATTNPIAIDRALRAGLAYLALGDWHGKKRIDERTWYAGTPEVDGFDVEDGGSVLLVEIPAANAAPVVTPLGVGRYWWRRLKATLEGPAEVDELERRIRGLAADPARMLLDLTVDGTLALADRARFEHQIGEGLRAALCHLRLDDGALVTAPSADDLDAIAPAGFVRLAAERLQAIAVAEGDLDSEAEDGNRDERDLAAQALLRLYLLRRKIPG